GPQANYSPDDLAAGGDHRRHAARNLQRPRPHLFFRPPMHPPAAAAVSPDGARVDGSSTPIRTKSATARILLIAEFTLQRVRKRRAIMHIGQEPPSHRPQDSATPQTSSLPQTTAQSD